MQTMRVSGNFSSVMNVMIMAVQKAASGLIRDFGELENLQSSNKSFNKFVSTADQRSEDILIKELSKARPEYEILTEESGALNAANPVSKFDKNWGFRWIIDPLDGTTNFEHGIPHFSVSVALEYLNEVIAGIVYNPIIDEMFIAEKGRGAFLNNQRLRVSNTRNLGAAIIATGSIFGFRNNKNAGEKLQALTPKIGHIRHFGACSLDLAFVAAGRLDAFFEESIQIWDKAAGIIIVSEAGGFVYSNEKSILASTPRIYKDLLEKLNFER
jgi:myo-inositol-1(or 4)-monophosphatase